MASVFLLVICYLVLIAWLIFLIYAIPKTLGCIVTLFWTYLIRKQHVNATFSVDRIRISLFNGRITFGNVRISIRDLALTCSGHLAFRFWINTCTVLPSPLIAFSLSVVNILKRTDAARTLIGGFDSAKDVDFNKRASMFHDDMTDHCIDGNGRGENVSISENVSQYSSPIILLLQQHIRLQSQIFKRLLKAYSKELIDVGSIVLLETRMVSIYVGDSEPPISCLNIDFDWASMQFSLVHDHDQTIGGCRTSGSLKNVVVCWVSGPDHPKESNVKCRFKMGTTPAVPREDGSLLAECSEVFVEYVHEWRRFPGIFPLRPHSLSMMNILPRLGDSLAWTFSADCQSKMNLHYSPASERQRVALMRKLFPPTFTNLTPDDGHCSSCIGFFYNIRTTLGVSGSLTWVVDTSRNCASVTGSQQSSMSGIIPTRVHSQGSTASLCVFLTDVISFTSLPYQKLFSTPKLQIEITANYPLKWNDLQEWRVKLSADITMIHLLYVHKLFFQGFLDDWMRGAEEARHIEFMPIQYFISVNVGLFNLVCPCNSNNVVDCLESSTEKNAYLCLRGVLKMTISIPIIEFCPELAIMTVELQADACTLYMLLPDITKSYGVATRLQKHMFILTPDGVRSNILDDKRRGSQFGSCELTCGRCPSIQLNFRYVYHPASSKGLRETRLSNDCTVELEIGTLVLWVTGSLIRRLWCFKENYFGTHQNFINMDTGKRCPSLVEIDENQLPLHTRAVAAIHNLQAHVADYSNTSPSPLAFTKRICAEVESSSEQFDVQIYVTPIVLFIFGEMKEQIQPQTEEDKSDATNTTPQPSSCGNLEIMHGLKFRGTAWLSNRDMRYGDEPVEYAWLVEVICGRITTITTVSQMCHLYKIVMTLREMLDEADFNLVKKDPCLLADPHAENKYTATRICLDGLDATIIVGENEITLLQVNPVHFRECSLHRKNMNGGSSGFCSGAKITHVSQDLISINKKNKWLQSLNVKLPAVKLNACVPCQNTHDRSKWLEYYDTKTKRIKCLWDKVAKCPCVGVNFGNLTETFLESECEFATDPSKFHASLFFPNLRIHESHPVFKTKYVADPYSRLWLNPHRIIITSDVTPCFRSTIGTPLRVNEVNYGHRRSWLGARIDPTVRSDRTTVPADRSLKRLSSFADGQSRLSRMDASIDGGRSSVGDINHISSWTNSLEDVRLSSSDFGDGSGHIRFDSAARKRNESTSSTISTDSLSIFAEKLRHRLSTTRKLSSIYQNKDDATDMKRATDDILNSHISLLGQMHMAIGYSPLLIPAYQNHLTQYELDVQDEEIFLPTFDVFAKQVGTRISQIGWMCNNVKIKESFISSYSDDVEDIDEYTSDVQCSEITFLHNVEVILTPLFIDCLPKIVKGVMDTALSLHDLDIMSFHLIRRLKEDKPSPGYLIQLNVPSVQLCCLQVGITAELVPIGELNVPDVTCVSVLNMFATKCTTNIMIKDQMTISSECSNILLDLVRLPNLFSQMDGVKAAVIPESSAKITVESFIIPTSSRKSKSIMHKGIIVSECSVDNVCIKSTWNRPDTNVIVKRLATDRQLQDTSSGMCLFVLTITKFKTKYPEPSVEILKTPFRSPNSRFCWDFLSTLTPTAMSWMSVSERVVPQVTYFFQKQRRSKQALIAYIMMELLNQPMIPRQDELGKIFCMCGLSKQLREKNAFHLLESIRTIAASIDREQMEDILHFRKLPSELILQKGLRQLLREWFKFNSFDCSEDNSTLPNYRYAMSFKLVDSDNAENTEMMLSPNNNNIADGYGQSDDLTSTVYSPLIQESQSAMGNRCGAWRPSVQRTCDFNDRILDYVNIENQPSKSSYVTHAGAQLVEFPSSLTSFLEMLGITASDSMDASTNAYGCSWLMNLLQTMGNQTHGKVVIDSFIVQVLIMRSCKVGVGRKADEHGMCSRLAALQTNSGLIDLLKVDKLTINAEIRISKSRRILGAISNEPTIIYDSNKGFEALDNVTGNVLDDQHPLLVKVDSTCTHRSVRTVALNIGVCVSKIKPVINIPIIRFTTQIYTCLMDALSSMSSSAAASCTSSTNNDIDVSSLSPTIESGSSTCSSKTKNNNTQQFIESSCNPTLFRESVDNMQHHGGGYAHSMGDDTVNRHGNAESGSSENTPGRQSLESRASMMSADRFGKYKLFPSGYTDHNVHRKDSSAVTRDSPNRQVNTDAPGQSFHHFVSSWSRLHHSIELHEHVPDIKEVSVRRSAATTFRQKQPDGRFRLSSTGIDLRRKQRQTDANEGAKNDDRDELEFHRRNKFRAMEQRLHYDDALHVTVFSWISITDFEICTDVGDLLLQVNLSSSKGSATIYKCLSSRQTSTQMIAGDSKPASNERKHFTPGRFSLVLMIKAISLNLKDVTDFDLPVLSFNITESTGFFAMKKCHSTTELKGSHQTDADVATFSAQMGLVTVDIPLILLDIHRLVTKNTKKIATAVLEYFPGVHEDGSSVVRSSVSNKVKPVSTEITCRIFVELKGVCLSDSLHTNLRAQYKSGTIDCNGFIGDRIILSCSLVEHSLSVMYKLGEPENETVVQFPCIKLLSTYSFEPVVKDVMFDHLDVTINVNQLKYTMPVDVLAELIFVQKVFMQSISKIFSKMDWRDQLARLKTSSNFDDSHFRYDVKAIMQGVELTCRTSSCTAVRIETGSQPMKLTITNWIDNQYLSSKPFIRGSMGIFIGLGQLALSIDDMHTFQQAAYFRTMIDVYNVIEKGRTDRDLFSIQVTSPLFYLQKGAFDAAIIFWINYKNAFNACVDQRVSSVRDEIMNESLECVRLESQGNLQIPNVDQNSSLNEFNVVVNLNISDLGVAFRLQQKPLVQIGDLDAANTLVFTLNKSVISGASFGKMIFAGHFTGFCLRFVDNFVATYDSWFPSARLDYEEINRWQVPYGSYQVYSKTERDVTSPIWDLVIAWKMKGIAINLNPTIGKDISMFCKAFTYESASVADVQANVSEANEAETQLKISYVRNLERRIEQLRLEDDSPGNIKPMVTELKELECELMGTFVKEFQRIFKSKPTNAKDSLGEKVLSVVERRVVHVKRNNRVQATRQEYDEKTFPLISLSLLDDSSIITDSKRPIVNVRLKLQIHIESGRALLTPSESKNVNNETCANTPLHTPTTTSFAIRPDSPMLNMPTRLSYGLSTSTMRQSSNDDRITEFILPGILINGNYSSSHYYNGDTLIRDAKLYCQCFVQSISNSMLVSPYLLDFLEQTMEHASQSRLEKHLFTNSYDSSCDATSTVGNTLTPMAMNPVISKPLHDHRKVDFNNSVIVKPYTASIIHDGCDSTTGDGIDSFKMDINVSVVIQPSTIMFTCYPWSRMECELRSPSVDLIFTRSGLRKYATEIESVPATSLLNEDDGVVSCSIDAKNFMLNVYHPYCASDNARVQGLLSSRSALILNVSSVLCNISRKRLSVEGNNVKLSVILSVGKCAFDYDVRRLQEILAFPRAWYKRSLMRRLFIGDFDSSSRTASRKCESSCDDGHLRANPISTGVGVGDGVSTWHTFIVFAVNIDHICISMKMSNIMGIVNWTTSEIKSLGQLTLDSTGARFIRLHVTADLSTFRSQQGIIGGLIRMKDLFIFVNLVESEDETQPIIHIFRGRLRAFEMRLEHMAESTMLCRICDLTAKIEDRWLISSDISKGRKPGSPSSSPLLCVIEVDFNQLHAMINASTTPDIMRMHVKLTEFIEQQMESSRKLFVVLRTQHPPASVMEQNKKDKSNLRLDRIKQWLRIRDGQMRISGSNFSLILFHGINFRCRQWAVFGINEPWLIFHSEQTQSPYTGVIQTITLHIGSQSPQGTEPKMASIFRVIKGVLVPSQFADIRGWFDYALLSIDVLGFHQFPTFEQSDVIRENGFDQTTETIFLLPKSMFCLRNEHNYADKSVKCTFDSGFATHALFTFNADHYMFLHDLIMRYISEKERGITTVSQPKSTQLPSTPSPMQRDPRTYTCPKGCWKLEPTIRLIAPFGSEVEPVGADKLLARLGFHHARTTIPKWLQRGLMDPSQNILELFTGGVTNLLPSRAKDGLIMMMNADREYRERYLRPNDKPTENP